MQACAGNIRRGLVWRGIRSRPRRPWAVDNYVAPGLVAGLKYGRVNKERTVQQDDHAGLGCRAHIIEHNGEPDVGLNVVVIMKRQSVRPHAARTSQSDDVAFVMPTRSRESLPVGALALPGAVLLLQLKSPAYSYQSSSPTTLLFYATAWSQTMAAHLQARYPDRSISPSYHGPQRCILYDLGMLNTLSLNRSTCI
jgi:hypothetical protein